MERLISQQMPPMTGTNYRVMRHILGVSLRSVARRAGWTPKTLSLLERQSTLIPARDRAKLDTAYTGLCLDKLASLKREGLGAQFAASTSDIAAILDHYLPYRNNEQ